MVITPAGRALGVGGLTLLCAGAALRNPEILTLGVVCVITLIAGTAWIGLRPRLEVQRDLVPSLVCEGEPARATLTVRNVGARTSSALTAVEQLTSGQLTVDVPRLAPGSEHRVGYRVPALRRGRHSIGPLMVGRTDPLHLLSAGHAEAESMTITVHPRLHQIPPLPAARAKDNDGPSVGHGARGGVAFHSLREYRPGDPPQLIHWRTTARLGTLMVRSLVTPTEPRLWVVLDTRPSAFQDVEAFEDAVRIAASLCIAACDTGHPLTVSCGIGSIPAPIPHGPAGRRKVLELLAVVERAPGSSEPAPAVLASAEDNASVAVVTGRVPGSAFLDPFSGGGSFRSVNLIAVGRSDVEPPSAAGARVFNARTSADFAALWTAGAYR